MFNIFHIKGGISALDSIYCDGVSAGLKANNALDVAFIYSKMPCEVAAIFTNNLFRAAPIEYFLAHSQNKPSNFVLINTKNANAMTGEKGKKDVGEILKALQEKFPKINNPIMASTGVIGEYLPKEKIINAFNLFDLENKNHANAANAILTTDRFPKEIALKIELLNDDGSTKGSFKIAAMAKGAGMIEPNMATMLCFIFTDSAIPKEEMKTMLKECSSNTFNAISVDGDTSTNDSVFLFSTKESKIYDKQAFKIALEMVMKKLAIDIISDGEGSTKVVAFEVKNALNKNEALKAAKTLANSLLVKTALFGGDPNWGRIASTIGSCGIKADGKRLKIFIGEWLVYDCEEIYFDNLQKAAQTMQKESFKITCDLGISNDSKSSFIAYGCDLGHQYVTINSDYRS